MKLSAEEYMDLCKRCWHSYIAFPAADFELAYANNVSPLDACTAIWSVHRKELSLTDPEAAPTQGADARHDRLRKFLDVAAGEGYVFDGVDAADLYLEFFTEGPNGVRHG